MMAVARGIAECTVGRSIWIEYPHIHRKRCSLVSFPKHSCSNNLSSCTLLLVAAVCCHNSEWLQSWLYMATSGQSSTLREMRMSLISLWRTVGNWSDQLEIGNCWKLNSWKLIWCNLCGAVSHNCSESAPSADMGVHLVIWTPLDDVWYKGGCHLQWCFMIWLWSCYEANDGKTTIFDEK